MHQRIPININGSNITYISKTTIDETFSSSSHSHPNLEILIITKGEGYINTSIGLINIKKDDLIIINPKNQHVEYSNELIEFYAIGLSSMSMIQDNDLENGIIKIDTGSYSDILKNMFEQIFEESFKKQNKYDLLISNFVNCLFIYIERKLNTSFNNHTDTESDIVNMVKSYINKNYSHNIELSDIARYVNLSVSSICHLFKKETGRSIIDYKIDKQLEEAHNLVSISDMSLNQISVFVGFNNQSYFNKLYKNKYNETPKQTKMNQSMNELQEWFIN